ncbi:hypothetical protein NCTGTJJY_CDS0222 [Serratia phage 92A1]|nr:hypothetical protein NCTGTJJY_CDS0222 [Serratia phage 92A1]
MISDVFNDDAGAGLADKFKACFHMRETSVVMDHDTFWMLCSLNGVDYYDMINETLEEMFDEYDAMNSIQRDEVVDHMADYSECDLNEIYARFPS